MIDLKRSVTVKQMLFVLGILVVLAAMVILPELTSAQQPVPGTQQNTVVLSPEGAVNTFVYVVGGARLCVLSNPQNLAGVACTNLVGPNLLPSTATLIVPLNWNVAAASPRGFVAIGPNYNRVCFLTSPSNLQSLRCANT